MSRRRPLLERLFSRLIINPDTGCVEWIGQLTRNGYGRIGAGGGGCTALATHRLMWEIFNGPIPDGLTVDHLCRNKICANVDHMELCTRRENSLRSDSPTARNARKTHCKRGHEFTPENTYVYNNSRSCRKCRVMWVIGNIDG